MFTNGYSFSFVESTDCTYIVGLTPIIIILGIPGVWVCFTVSLYKRLLLTAEHMERSNLHSGSKVVLYTGNLVNS